MHNLTFKINFHIKKNLLIYIQICPTGLLQNHAQLREISYFCHIFFSSNYFSPWRMVLHVLGRGCVVRGECVEGRPGVRVAVHGGWGHLAHATGPPVVLKIVHWLVHKYIVNSTLKIVRVTWLECPPRYKSCQTRLDLSLNQTRLQLRGGNFMTLTEIYPPGFRELILNYSVLFNFDWLTN